MALSSALRSNERQTQRRNAVGVLNSLAGELNVQKVPVKSGAERVQTLIRELDRRCADSDTSARLRAVLDVYHQNGGALPAKLRQVPAPDSTPPSQVQLQRHRVLDEGFRLQSKAFMLTYNCKEFSTDTWQRFLTWVKGTVRKLHARRWAACLEESLHAHAVTSPGVYHLHTYLWWTDGNGVRFRNTDVLVFDGVRPRVDTCVCQVCQSNHVAIL